MISAEAARISTNHAIFGHFKTQRRKREILNEIDNLIRDTTLEEKFGTSYIFRPGFDSENVAPEVVHELHEEGYDVEVTEIYYVNCSKSTKIDISWEECDV